MKKILKNTDYVEVAYIQKYKLVQIIWKSKIFTFEDYKDTYTKAMDFSENNKSFVINLLSDIREQGIVSPNDRNWFQDVAVPRAREVNLKRTAVIIPNNPFKKYYMNILIKATNKFKIPLKLFSDYDSALNWCISFKDYE